MKNLKQLKSMKELEGRTINKVIDDYHRLLISFEPVESDGEVDGVYTTIMPYGDDADCYAVIDGYGYTPLLYEQTELGFYSQDEYIEAIKSERKQYLALKAKFEGEGK